MGIFGRGTRGPASAERDSDLPLLTAEDADYLRECALWALAELGITAELDGGFVVAREGGSFALDGLQKDLRRVDRRDWPDRILALFGMADLLAHWASAVDPAAEAEPTAPGYALLNSDDVAELQRLIIDYFETEHGAQVKITDGTVTIEGPFQGMDDVEFGLTNLERRIFASERADWAATVATHFASLTGKSARHDTENVGSRLIVRLTNPDHDRSGTFDYAPRWVEPLVGGLAVDNPDSVSIVYDANVSVAGDLDQAYQHAWANLRRELNAAELTFNRSTVTEELWVDEVSGANYHLATAAFLLDEYLPKWYPGTDLSGGVVFGIPHRFSIFLRPVQHGGIAPTNLSAVAAVVNNAWTTGINPVSPHVYFWHPTPYTTPRNPEPGPFNSYLSRGGRIMQLTGWDDAGEVKIMRWPQILAFN